MGFLEPQPPRRLLGLLQIVVYYGRGMVLVLLFIVIQLFNQIELNYLTEKLHTKLSGSSKCT